MAARIYIVVFLHLVINAPRYTMLACPANFPTDVNGNGQLCLHISTNRENYCGAQRACHALGGELLTGESQVQQFWNKIPDLINNGKLSFNRFFFGFTDLYTEGTFRWTNGAKATNSTIPWSYGEWVIGQNVAEWQQQLIIIFRLLFVTIFLWILLWWMLQREFLFTNCSQLFDKIG